VAQSPLEGGRHPQLAGGPSPGRSGKTGAVPRHGTGPAPGGALLIADLVKPATAAGAALAARAWDGAVRRRSLEIAGTLGPYETFRAERWNYYADPEPDPIDQPSTLLDQLRWLEEAGLTGVDVHWMKAGHAIFGGIGGIL